ncbi:5-dehydro-2-deoxygluconokinase [Streptomyces oceani]|uniref:5-dehydro-2-deoxygluconokinase n=1 Tax=Streptomyces oceani TaxID=1075402 RepID=A0A1E7KFT1_9ACTN|nr:5-dehydro-2-deoxygluconokinase [Streptomyces oceani]OEV02789.1 5-dehydro-2-deoxygluconokinase [Streptomyces oceani]
MSPSFDVLTMGRIGVDIYPLQTGVGLAEVDTFAKFLGGSATNVAVAAARLGRTSAVITRTGTDPFGDYCHQALREFGVDDRWVTPVRDLPTPVTFCEIFPPDHFPLYFYRWPKAPDLEIDAAELDLEAVRAARILWVTGTGLCAEPSRSATLAALRARGDGGGGGQSAVDPKQGAGQPEVASVLDLDWRPMFWSTEAADVREIYQAALAHASVAVGNLDECEVATGLREPRACAESLLASGATLAVVKKGPEGVLAAHRDGTIAELPPHPVEVVNGLGAGDAFGGALCHGLLADWDLARLVRYANAAGALVAGRLACSSAMPVPSEVDALLDG